jgi:SAM-dependent methyltransferase
VDARHADPQWRFWNDAFSGLEYYYGFEPGPVARRAVRYHRPRGPEPGTALDVGCGEGQDLAFLAERGYRASGLELTETGAAKAHRLLRQRGRAAEVLVGDIRDLAAALGDRRFDLVLAVNSIQFLGADAPAALEQVRDRTAPGGVIGLSLFGREQHEPELSAGCWFVSLEGLMARFRGWQMLETARLWQWNPRTNDAQPFVTMVAQAPG